MDSKNKEKISVDYMIEEANVSSERRHSRGQETRHKKMRSLLME